MFIQNINMKIIKKMNKWGNSSGIIVDKIIKNSLDLRNGEKIFVTFEKIKRKKK